MLALAVMPCPAALETDGRVAVESRWFYHAPSPQLTGSVAATSALTQTSADERWRLHLHLFGRVDAQDRERTHADAREAYVQWLGDTAQLSLGLGRVFWGVTESRHLVDVVNQSDFVEDLEAEHKFGQPMLSYTLAQDWGSLEAYLLPYFRERSFPGAKGHPRVPVPIAEEETQYASRHGRRHLDYAARYSHALLGVDLGIGWFQGTARDPRLQLCFERGSRFGETADGPDCSSSQTLLAGQGPDAGPTSAILQRLGLAPDDRALREQVIADLQVVPRYEQTRQLSIDALYVTGAWAFKLEALARQTRGKRSHAAVLGLEYTLGTLWGTGSNLGLVAERLRDEQSDVFSARFDNEWFAGLRLGFNDRRSTTLLAGLLANTAGSDRLLQIEGSQMLAPQWRIFGLLRSFDRVRGDELTGFLRDEDQLSLTLERQF